MITHSAKNCLELTWTRAVGEGNRALDFHCPREGAGRQWAMPWGGAGDTTPAPVPP